MRNVKIWKCIEVVNANDSFLAMIAESKIYCTGVRRNRGPIARYSRVHTTFKENYR
jgi:hypothetical protein